MITFPLLFLGIIIFDTFYSKFVQNFSFSPSFQEGENKREGISIYLPQQTFISMSRKVSVYIFQYPKDANSSLSLRRLLEIREELIYQEKFVSSQPLNVILQQFCDNTHDYALMCDVEHCFRIVVRDSESRLSISFRA